MADGSEPRRHHYVPQFYLRRFCDANGRLWAWDKAGDRVFQTSPNAIANETDFYRLRNFEEQGQDPYILEKQLAQMENQAAAITGQWLDWLRILDPGRKIPIPKVHRYIVARFMVIQHLRTADTREIFEALAKTGDVAAAKGGGDLHGSLLWDQKTVRLITNHIRNAVWIFARNHTGTPYITSDNPMAFRTKDNRMWLKLGIVSEGVYAVYPLAPDIVMYCHERKFWNRIRHFDRSLSIVPLTAEMVESENSGQVFMAGRFVLSPIKDFRYAREFAPTIGTDLYAPPELRGKSPNDVLFGSSGDGEVPEV
jgi:hypothetical protein